MSQENRNLPTVQELYTNLETYKEKDDLNFLLNNQPPEDWIKKHPIIKIDDYNEEGVKVGKKPYPYLPIDKVEHLLRRIFKFYKIEVLREGNAFNSVYCAVRVHYKDITTGEWLFHDGVGAAEIQTNAGKSASDLGNIKSAAVMMALPRAKSLAIKDACDHFGDLFGANLNRRDVVPNIRDAKLLSNDDKLQEIKSLFNEFEEVIPEEEKKHYERIIKNEEKLSYNRALRGLRKLQNGSH